MPPWCDSKFGQRAIAHTQIEIDRGLGAVPAPNQPRVEIGPPLDTNKTSVSAYSAHQIEGMLPRIERPRSCSCLQALCHRAPQAVIASLQQPKVRSYAIGRCRQHERIGMNRLISASASNSLSSGGCCCSAVPNCMPSTIPGKRLPMPSRFRSAPCQSAARVPGSAPQPRALAATEFAQIVVVPQRQMTPARAVPDKDCPCGSIVAQTHASTFR